MLKVCPKCKCSLVEFDQHQRREHCLNNDCRWVNYSGVPIFEGEPRKYKFSEVMVERVSK